MLNYPFHGSEPTIWSQRSTSLPNETFLDNKIKLKLGQFSSYSSFTVLHIPALFKCKSSIHLITKIQARHNSFGSGNKQEHHQRGDWPTCSFDSEPHLTVAGIVARINCTPPQILVHTNEPVTLDAQVLIALQKVIWEGWHLEPNTRQIHAGAISLWASGSCCGAELSFGSQHHGLQPENLTAT